MRVTALVENTSAREGIGSEHGLSLLIETGEEKILFDMGQTDLFGENAKRLGIDLATVTSAVLSHGHYDHGGGLARFLQINSKAPIYLHPKAFEPHFHGPERYIGLDPTLRGNARFRMAVDGMKIGAGLWLFASEGREMAYPFSTPELTVVEEGKHVPDDFSHEIYLLAEEGKNRVLFSGCSHKGILDIAEWFSPDALVGGFHFSKMPLDGALAEAARTLTSHSTAYYTCHCTGEAQFAYMKQYIQNLRYLSCGEVIEI
jgi:7,8-dihydropterin-6-yl-methyl-4-(beta-D-ribofuranosyl)aminobenzene 5'-phosphate synthase